MAKKIISGSQRDLYTCFYIDTLFKCDCIRIP